MVDRGFSEWLSQKSWAQAVRFAKVVAILIPVSALAVDIPVLQDPKRRVQVVWLALMLWHVVAELILIGVILVDRFARERFGAQARVNFFAATVLIMSTWIGVTGSLTIGDYSIYALGSLFVATVICTPRHVRRPIYAVSAVVIFAFIYLNVTSPDAIVTAAVNPLCVAVVSFQLDKYTYEGNVALFTEMQRAEHERARADKVLYNVFPISIADELKRDERVNAVKFEGMGVMFADIVGFTSFSKSLPPDALVFVLNQIFSMFDQLVDRYNLEKIKTIGDAYMVISQKQTQSLVSLALDMLDGIKAYNQSNGTDFQLRIGVHVGPAVAGVIGVKRFLYDVWGDTVNVASRMESTGEPGRIHVTQAVQSQLEGQFSFEQCPPIEVKGKGVMTTYFLTRAARTQEAQPGAALALGA